MSRFMDILKNVGSDIFHDAKRMVELGASEGANALNHGHAFVLYGPNQRPAAGEKAFEQPEQPEIESPEQSNGRSM
jgi:hypothetical protein